MKINLIYVKQLALAAFDLLINIENNLFFLFAIHILNVIKCLNFVFIRRLRMFLRSRINYGAFEWKVQRKFSLKEDVSNRLKYYIQF